MNYSQVCLYSLHITVITIIMLLLTYLLMNLSLLFLVLYFQESGPLLIHASECVEGAQTSPKEVKLCTGVQISSPQHNQEPEGIEQGTETAKANGVIRIHSGMLAAAIVNSAPLYRRQAFLQPSNPLKYSPATSCLFTSDSAMKRRTWHMERVTARMLSFLGDSERSLTSLPTLNRSQSNETTACGKTLRCFLGGAFNEILVSTWPCLNSLSWFPIGPYD